ncbi:MAG: phosphodiester glycosidase family protein [Oscillospiraceae bacterium]|nr:phosphodiester glycosidase family protein [Oscillospiraceae bacterium]
MHNTIREHKQCPFVLLLLLDILVTALLVLVVYYTVYELPTVFPRDSVEVPATVSNQTSSLPASEESTAAVDEILSNQLSSLPASEKGTTAMAGISGSQAVSTSVPEEITAKDWKTKFSEHFTSEIVSTDTAYTSPNLSVNITTHTMGSGDNTVTYYIADVYIADISSFQTHFAYDTYGSYKQSLSDMSSEVSAVLAMNGDSYCFNLKHLNGLLVRNGTVYRTNPTTADICVLYSDGTMVTSSPNDFDAQQAIDGDALQTWIFGPKLLDDSGKALTEFNTWDYIRKSHPRSAIGYYEPGHYCFVVVDGRQTGYSRGMTLPELAKVFENLGCTAAYNLDGGHTTFMTLNSAVVNQPYKPTKTISDCIYICELSN